MFVRFVRCPRRSFARLRLDVRHRKERAAAFIRGHAPQSGEDFCRACLSRSDNESVDLALGLRRAIARFGRVPEQYVRAEMKFFDLEALPDWAERIDVYFNNERWYRLLRLETGRAFTEKDLGRIPDPESGMRLRVREFVAAAVSYFVHP
jgi:hypothetical protein